MKEQARSVTVIIPAAGSAMRMKGIHKTFFVLNGTPVLLRTIRLFEDHPAVGEIIVAVKEQDLEAAQEMIRKAALRVKTIVIVGGDSRHASVKNALKASDPSLPFVAIHDAARPLCGKEDIEAVFQKAFACGAAALGVPVKDTIKQTAEGKIVKTLPREELTAIQTPQVFEKARYLQGMQEAERTGADYTDDCQLIEAIGGEVAVVLGSDRNFKLTTPFDLRMAETLESGNEAEGMNIRIGHGYDVHRLTTDRKLILGGVDIPFHKGLDGHSDADVLAHAIMDGMLGALALGDIGKHFPDTDETYRGADSMKLMAHTVALIRQQGWEIGNIDATILAQAPKLAPYIAQMRQNIAAVCGISADRVSVKATTEEKLGFTGNGDGMAVHAVCLLKK